MAKEDFTTYTEVDPNSRITVTADRSEWAGLDKNEDAYVYDDKGVNHFDGDFEHLLTIYADTGVEGAHVVPWALGNVIDSWIPMHDDRCLSISIFYPSTDAPRLDLDEWVGGVRQARDSVNINIDTPYYLTIKRDENVGTYGTLYCYIYSDAARTNLVTTLSIALSEKADYRYIYVTQSANNNTTPYTQSGYSEDLDLQEVVVYPRSRGYIF